MDRLRKRGRFARRNEPAGAGSASACGGAATISRADPTSEMMVSAPIAAASIEVRVTPSASVAGKTTTAAPMNAAGGSAAAPTRDDDGLDAALDRERVKLAREHRL